VSVGEVFTNAKWDIIKDLSLKKLSPIQLAERYKTTPGNIGHQLRLLEAYGLIKKEKVSNRDKGKPRTLFSLSNDYGYIVTATKNFAQKRLLKLSNYHDTILKMWFIEDPRFHYPLEKFYWKIEDHINKINGIAVRISGLSKVEVIILSNKKQELVKNLGDSIKINDKEGNVINFDIKFLDSKQIKRTPRLVDFHFIHDPNSILQICKESYQSEE
jgi:predicted transcriptional regulator